MASDPKRAAFYSLLDSHDSLIRLLDDELMAECSVPLVWFDVLIKLWVAPNRSLLMSELADQVLLSRSWITRRVSQLERAGLVQRIGADGDGRKVVATFTSEGVEVFRRLERSHASSIRRHFSDLISEDEAAVVQAVLTRVADHGRRIRSGRPVPPGDAVDQG